MWRLPSAPPLFSLAFSAFRIFSHPPPPHPSDNRADGAGDGDGLGLGSRDTQAGVEAGAGCAGGDGAGRAARRNEQLPDGLFGRTKARRRGQRLSHSPVFGSAAARRGACGAGPVARNLAAPSPPRRFAPAAPGGIRRAAAGHRRRAGSRRRTAAPPQAETRARAAAQVGVHHHPLRHGRLPAARPAARLARDHPSPRAAAAA